MSEAPNELSEPSRSAGAESRSPREAARESEQRPTQLLAFGGATGVCLAVDLVSGLVNGRGSSFLSAVFVPVLAGGVIALTVGALLRLRRRQFLSAGATLLVVLGLVGYVGSGAFARGMIFPGARQPLPAPGTALGTRAKVVGYTTSDGIELKGIFARGGGKSPRPAVVFFHGNADCAAYNQNWAYQLARANLDVFVGEYRGYGGCPGSPSQAGLRLDGLAAIAALERELGGKPPKLVVMGRSLGTGLASLLAGEGHGDAVILLSPFTSVQGMATRIAPRPMVALALRDPFDSQGSLLRSKQPVLIYHGTADRVVPCAEGEALAAALGKRARLHTIDGVGHDDIIAAAGREIAHAAAALFGP